MKKYKMLFAGESWLTHNMEVKGGTTSRLAGMERRSTESMPRWTSLQRSPTCPPIWWERNFYDGGAEDV